MESVISKIIEIDKNASERINSASEKQKQILEDSENQCRKIREEIAGSADKRIAEVEGINKSEFEAETAELEKKISDAINEMNTFYEQNHERIEKEIFAEIVGE